MSLTLNILSMSASSCNESRHDGSNFTVNSNLIELGSKFSSPHTFETNSECEIFLLTTMQLVLPPLY